MEHLTGIYPVATDGTVNLHNCGMINLAGKTVTEAREAIQTQLTQYFDAPRVGVEVVQFNSKSYYVVSEGWVNGTVWRFPITGNETVLDALAQMDRVSNISSKTIWIARPKPDCSGEDQILPIDWNAISRGALTDTNYQILPGDRVYVVNDSLVAVNTFLDKVTSPVQRLLSISTLGATTARNMQSLGREYNKVNHRSGDF
jgi:polysaccharide biosynthesis/export protein